MPPLIAPTAVTVLALIARRPPLLALRLGIAAMFVVTGAAHFIGMREELIAMVPPWLPAPELLVTITGALELAGAVGVVLPATAPWAAAGLGTLLVAMFPANVHLALTNPDLPFTQQLVPRTVIQLIFLAATTTVVVAYARTRRSASTDAADLIAR